MSHDARWLLAPLHHRDLRVRPTQSDHERAHDDRPVHDVQVTDTIHHGLAERNLLPAEHFVDSGYTKARVLVSAHRDYDIETVGPVQATAAWQAKADDGFAQAKKDSRVSSQPSRSFPQWTSDSSSSG